MSLQNKFNLVFFSKQAVMYVPHHINFTVILSRVCTMLKRFLDKSNGFLFYEKFTRNEFINKQIMYMSIFS